MLHGLIEIYDEVNVQIRGVPAPLIKTAIDRVSWHVPNYKFMQSVRMGSWDGKIRLMSPSGKTYLYLLDDILPVFEGMDFTVEDHRNDWSDVISQIKMPDENLFSEYTWDGTEYGTPIVLRDYQIEAVRKAISSGQGILEMATGSGKTLVCAALCKVYQEFGKVILIVPNIDLAIQTRETILKKCHLEAGIWYGQQKEEGQIIVSTWQSLANTPELFADVVCVIVDEAHQAKAKTIQELLTGPGANVPFRFGCTGTVPKADLHKKQIFSSIGEVIYQLSSYKLQELGVLAQSYILDVTLLDNKNPNLPDPETEYDLSEWGEYLEWAMRDPKRAQAIADIITQMRDEHGNTLVLVPRKEHGFTLQALIPGAVNLNGDDRAKARKVEYEKFNEGDGGVLICTVDIASTGLDIPRLKAMLFFELGKKFEKTMQSIGRGLRKAHDKDFVFIVDMHGDGKTQKTQSTKRRSYYKAAKLKCDRVELDYANS